LEFGSDYCRIYGVIKQINTIAPISPLYNCITVYIRFDKINSACRFESLFYDFEKRNDESQYLKI
jgi:hypothetical protein